MTKEEEITRNLSLIEYYKEQLNSVDIQTQYMQAALTDYHKARLTIEQLHNADENSDILIPVGGGAFINGSIKNVSNVLVDIGAGLVAEKTIDDALKKIDERIKSLQENQERLLSMAQKLQEDGTELSKKTQKLMEETRE
jgi:prefoldin alpha subunit